MSTKLEIENSEAAKTDEEEETLPSTNAEGEDEVRSPFRVRGAVFFVGIILFFPFAPFVAIAVLAHGSSFCPLYPVIRYPCCEPDFNDLWVTFPLFGGMLLTCRALIAILSQRWMTTKFQTEGERIKGIVSDKRTWTTTNEGPNATTHTHHCELIVKYPAEGTSLVSPSCVNIVTKTFDGNKAYNNGSLQMSIGSEIELFRMAASDGYDPRKTILVLRIISDREFYSRLCAYLLFGIVWNSFWVSLSCIALFWSWPLAILLSYIFSGDITLFGCCNVALFKKFEVEGEISNRYDQGEDTTSDERRIDQPLQVTHKKELDDTCGLDWNNTRIV